MSPVQGFLCLVVCFFAPSVVYLLLGLCLVKTERFHKIGVRMLAMSVLVPSSFIAKKCRQPCADTRCGNWTCSKY